MMHISAEIIFNIEKACFNEFSDFWSMEMINAHLNSGNAITLIKTVNGEPAGYAAGIKLDGEAELYRIAVLPKYRGQGFAKELLARFIKKAAGDVFLEVRSRNAAAIALYKSAGFKEIAVRKNYYGDDDAVIYKLEKK